MDKNDFGKLVDCCEVTSSSEWESLRRERDRYPYCAPLQILALKVDKANGAPLWEQRTLPMVELYVQDRVRLHEQLSASHAAESEPISAPMAKDLPSETQPVAVTNPAVGEGYDVLREINAYQEVSFKTAPKSVILSNFLEKDGGIHLENDDFVSEPVQELAKKSILPIESLDTESMAVVLEKQGKVAQAIAIYEKLMVNNPKKSSTFAIRIAALKTQLNNE